MKRSAFGLSSKTGLYIALLTITLTTWLCYRPSLQNGFTNWDDHLYVTENPDLDLLKPGNLHNLLTKDYASNYHPITMLSLGINRLMSGNDPKGYHRVNLAFHLFNTLLVFWLIFLLWKRINLDFPIWGAFITSLLFGIHPLHVESVAWISERKDLLFTFFFLLSTGCYIKYLNTLKTRSYIYFISAVLFFALSLLSKAQAASLAVTLLLIDYLFGRNIWDKRVLFEKIPFFILSVFLGIIAINAQKVNFHLADKYDHFQRLVFASYGYSSYLLKTIAPFNLSAFYPYPETITAVYYLALSSLIITISVLFFFRKNRVIVFGILFFIINISLVLQYFPVGDAIMADRYFYVPSIGLFFLIAFAITNFTKNYRMGISLGLTAYIIGLAVLTTNRVTVWENPVTLWESVLSYNNKTAIAWYNLAHYRQYTLADFKNALSDYNKAIECKYDKPDRAYNNRGDLKISIGDTEAGIADFNQALLINPQYFEAYYNRGNAWQRKDSLSRAILDYNRSIEINPLFYLAFNNRGYAYCAAGKLEKAIESFGQAIELNKKNDEPKAFSYFGRGNAYLIKGNYQKAFADINSGLAILPIDHQALQLKKTISEALKSSTANL